MRDPKAPEERQESLNAAGEQRREWITEENARLRKLWDALRTRPLSDEEMAEVLSLGEVVMTGYFECRLTNDDMLVAETRMFNDALFLQYRIRSFYQKGNEGASR